MAFSRSLLEQACTLLHRAAELSHVETGIALPHLLLITPNLAAEGIMLPGGIPGAASTAALRRRVAGMGAVAAVYTVECWLGFVSVPLSGFARLEPEDLPRAADLPDRLEALVTTAVWPGAAQVPHRVTVITRTPGGSVLGAAQWLPARDYGTNRWLESLFTPP